MGLTQKLGTIPLAVFTDSSNNVGIGGAANASYKLAVTGTGSLTGNLAVGGTTNDTSGGLYSNIAIDATSYSRYSLLTSGTARGRFQFDGTNTSMLATSTGGKLQLQTLGANAMEFYTNDTLRATITSSGEINMGNPPTIYGRLNVQSTGTQLYNGVSVFSTDGTQSFIGLGCSGTTAGIIVTYGSTGSYLPFVVITGGSERMRITSGGNVGIGNTGTSTVRLFIDGSTNDSTAFAQYSRSNNGSTLMYVRNDGYGYLLDSAWHYGSDIRLKENISDIESSLSIINSLKPKHFDYINGGKNRVGFIAQEVQEILPQLVSISNEETGILALQTDALIPYLVKAIQELSAKVTALENR